jgi:hypothetical protein
LLSASTKLPESCGRVCENLNRSSPA